MDAGGRRGGAGAQEWEGGGLDALRGAGGWGRGLEGEAPERQREGAAAADQALQAMEGGAVSKLNKMHSDTIL